MNDYDRKYQEMRDIWYDHNHRQEFEHTLINRQTTWLLTTQTILFAAYGVTFDSKSTAQGLDDFRKVIAYLGVFGAAVMLAGVVCLIRSKYLSWRKYCAFFAKPASPNLPRPFGLRLEWGVDTTNTWGTLAPDLLLPCAFILAWCAILLWV